MKILIAEDDENSRVFLERALVSQGYAVESAGNGSQALEKAVKSPPDLIISDIMMPNMDGFELCRLVKMDERLRAIPFVFYTATFVEQQDEKLAMSLGASRFLIKPMEPEEFFSSIREVIDKYQEIEHRVVEGPATEIRELDRMYAEVLARKLEKKVSQLEETLGLLGTSEERFRHTFEQAAVGIAHVALDGRFIRVNQKLADIVGYSREELQDRTFQDITYPNDFDTDLAYMRQLLEHTLQTYSMEKRYIHKDEHLVWVNLTVSLVAATSLNSGYFIAVVEDITKRKQLEAQLRQSQKMEAIGLLAGGVAHDFNNVLTAIYGYCAILQAKMTEDSPFMFEVDQIHAAAERAATLTRSLLAFSREQIMQPQQVDLNDIVKNVWQLLTRIIGEDIHLEIIVAEEPLWIFADSVQIEQVLMNLAANARDAMPNGGRLTIETEDREIDEGFMLTHGFCAPGKYAVISLSDDGIGMDAETSKKIFEPFFTTKELGKGTGLGLSIVYGVIKQHSGNISVYSEPGLGTTFRIYLPITKEEHVSDERIVLLPPKGGNETILCAEDDDVIRGLVTQLLGSYGYNVITAENGVDAIARFKEHKNGIDLLLFDLIMPKKNGKEASDEIRKMNPGVRTLFMTGYSSDLLQDRGMLEENPDVVMKPISPMALLRKVREVLDK